MAKTTLQSHDNEKAIDMYLHVTTSCRHILAFFRYCFIIMLYIRGFFQVV